MFGIAYRSTPINSIYDVPRFRMDAFQLGTNKIHDVGGTVQGIDVYVIDTYAIILLGLTEERTSRLFTR